MIYQTQNGTKVDLESLTLKELRLLNREHSEDELKNLLTQGYSTGFNVVISDKLAILTGIDDYRDLLINRQQTLYPVYSHFQEKSGIQSTSWKRMEIKDSHLLMESLLKALDVLDLKMVIIDKNFQIPKEATVDNTEALSWLRQFNVE